LALPRVRGILILQDFVVENELEEFCSYVTRSVEAFKVFNIQWTNVETSPVFDDSAHVT
jgi:hypothetical protein